MTPTFSCELEINFIDIITIGTFPISQDSIQMFNKKEQPYFFMNIPSDFVT